MSASVWKILHELSGSASTVQYCTAAGGRLPDDRCAMRQPPPIPPDSEVALLVQPRDDGLDMYLEFLRHRGLAVIGVSDAWDALIAAPRAAIIVTGILLAGSMDGVELIGRLRRDERTNRTPIIVLTACAWSAERERAESAGCDLFLPKPCLPDELLRHVRQLLAQSRLRHVRGQPIKADLLNEPHDRAGIADGSRRLKRPG
jgi:two-component system cell cycle response regulator DivK